MAVYRRSSRTRYLIAVLVLAALTLVTLNARSGGTGLTSDARGWASDVFSPLQRATHDALRPIGNFLTGALDYGSLRAENQRLRQEIASLQTQGVSAAAEKAAAEQVLALHNLPFLAGIPSVTAEVINTGSSNFEDTVTVDMGTSDGIASGQPVVAAGGLVGSVETVSSHTATIVLLTDPTFAVGVHLPGGNVGTVQGEGLGEPLKVTVDSTKLAPPKVTKGQGLVTTGFAVEPFPPDVPVGTVRGVSQAPGVPEPTITLNPLVNLQQLSYVDVLLWSQQ